MSSFEQGEAFAGGFLEHWGIKGMRWGVRKRDSGGVSGGRDQTKDGDSEDFARTAAVAIKAHHGGLRSLSNKELRDLVDRINLEQNFNRATTPQAKPSNVGVTYVTDKFKKMGDMTIDTLLKTAVQVNVETQKDRMRVLPKVAA